MKRISVIVVCLAVGLWAGATLGDTITVPGDFSEIHDAVQAASAGDTVLVAAGTYNDCTHDTGDGTPACVIMKTGVTLIGAGQDATIIDAQQLGRGIFMELVSDVRIENLQVTNAFAEVYGAAILVRQVDSSVEITDVKIHANGDGGIICVNNAAPIITAVTFTDNAAKQGGGLSLEENSPAMVTGCLFDNNEAPFAAGMFIRQSDAVVTDCIFENNFTSGPTGGGNGGGMVVTDSAPTIDSCTFRNNFAGVNGGGIAYENSPGGTLSNCMILSNEAAGLFGLGGGITLSSSGTALSNVIVAGNAASGPGGSGGGIYIEFGTTTSLTYVTVTENSCGGAGFGGNIYCDWFTTPTIDKCIIAFAGTGAGLACNAGNLAEPVVSCTDIYGNAGGDDLCGTDAGGNFSEDPLFCGDAGFEYHLQAGSPCAPGNHPGGPSECDGDLIGALSEGCGGNPVQDTPEVGTNLLGNAPNPFNPRTTIFFMVEATGPTSLRIFDVRGHHVRTYQWSELPAGMHEVVWNGKDHSGQDMPSGVYLYQLEAHGVVQTQRMSLIR